MIGGGGERKTLRLVAEYADASNFFGGTEEIVHKIAVLRAHCAEAEHDPAEIEITVIDGELLRDPSPDAIVRRCEALAAVGVSTVMTGPVGAEPAAKLEATFGPVIDRIRAIEHAAI